jgi:tetratricopeptide (TPR) repeat protein
VKAVANWQDQLSALSEASRLESIAAAEGATYGPLLLNQQPGDWRGMMRSDPHYRSYGTLMFLLGDARARFETAPTIAREITAAVLDFVDEAKGPSHIHNIGLRGLAEKEHANACQKTGDLRTALRSAERSVEIYGESPGLLFEQTRAQLVVCKILREVGETNRAMDLARRCATIFNDFDDATFTNMARMFEAGVLYSSKRFTEALAIFTTVSEHAERAGDRLTIARCLQCAADCARELGDLDGARDLYPRALAHFEALNIPSDANCTRWALALTLAASGKVSFAVSELFKVRAVFLSLGMNSQAASAALDIVRIKFDAGEDVRGLCSEIVPLLTEAGLTQNAVEALAYIREQAKRGKLTTSKITRVRTYFDELATKPLLLFARPREEEEG